MAHPASPDSQTRPSSSSAKPYRTATSSNLSFARRKNAQMSEPATAPIVDGDDLLRPVDGEMPGDGKRQWRKSKSRSDLAKHRSSFFEDAFQGTREVNQGRDRIRSEAIVLADIRTNVIVSDEFTFLSDVTYQLSVRYQRPVSSIAVTVQHGICMLFGGTFDPAYVMSIHALPCEIQTTKNKRNTVLLQNHMQETLMVPPSRGYIQFVAVPEENSACNGKTTAGEIAELEGGDDDQSLSQRRARKRLTVKSFTGIKTGSGPNSAELTPPHSAELNHAPIPELPKSPSIPEEKPESLLLDKSSDGGKEHKKVKHRKSFVATLFHRSPRPDKEPPMPRKLL